MTEPWALSIDDAAALIGRRELSAGELLASLLERINQTEERFQAWTSIDIEGAMEAARQADQDSANHRKHGWLHGIPIGVKDVIDTAGWPTEAGSRACAGRIPAADAASVAALRTAGATILGKTVTHEFAYGQNTPPTRSPWGLDRYPGGSSAGSGVAVAAGHVPGALGTDTAGSIRNPAAVNGIVGLRPTTGLVNTDGLVGLSPRLDQVGPIARSVTDCTLLLAGLVDDAVRHRLGNGDDPVRALRNRAASHDSVRVGVDRASWAESGVTADVIAVLEEAVEDLRRNGAHIVEVSLPELRIGLPITLVFCLLDASEKYRTLLAARAADMAPGTRVMFELGLVVTDADLDLALNARRFLQQTLRRAFEEHRLTALASPTLPAVAPRLADLATDLTRDGEAADLSGALLLLSPSNVCGLPGLSLPCGKAGGLPVGMHLLGRPFDDLDLLALGYRYEQETPWKTMKPDCWQSVGGEIDLP
ncbi:amidase [Streptomyces sp. NPDC056821]|uniref:amidase n=1 Tax=unclassified Streptomyces TaxID=2593676 RepID=UPI0036814FED